MALTRKVNGIEVQLTPQEEADRIAESNANEARALAEKPMNDAMDNLNLRQGKVLKLRAYLRSQISNNTTFENVQTTVTPFIQAYLDGSDRILSWIKGENSLVYGNYLLTGFPSKPYFTVQRQADLLNILQ